MEQNRWASPVLWAAIVAQLAAVLMAVGVLPPVWGDKINEVAALVLQLLVLFGVLNNPTDKTGF